jgi:hypothetical protein
MARTTRVSERLLFNLNIKRTLLCGLVEFTIRLQVHINIEHVCTGKKLGYR